MALPLPNLDDRTYADLVEEARSFIPSLYPAWTDHNPSDPGITLVELFAWLTEMLLYRANRVPDTHVEKFLKLLDPQFTRSPDVSLEEQVRATVVNLRRQYQAVTAGDYEQLAREAAPESVARVKCVPRRNLARGTEEERRADWPGHVSVIVLPEGELRTVFYDGAYHDRTGAAFELNGAPAHFLYVGLAVTYPGMHFELNVPGAGYSLGFEYFDGARWTPLTAASHGLVDRTGNWTSDGLVEYRIPSDWRQTRVGGLDRYWVRISTSTAPTTRAQASRLHAVDLIERLELHLEPRRLLTARVHVVEPVYVPVRAEVLVARRADALEGDVRASVVAELERFLDPYKGGPLGQGWPFGRDVYVSELYELLERLPGVDYVSDIGLTSECESGAMRCAEAEPLLHPSGEFVGLGLQAHHLPRAHVDPANVVVATTYVPLQVQVEGVTAAAGYGPVAVLGAVQSAVRRFFHPAYAGPDGKSAWRSGTSPWDVQTTTIRTALLSLPETDQVGSVELHADGYRLQRDGDDNVTGVRLGIRELADVSTDARLGE